MSEVISVLPIRFPGVQSGNLASHRPDVQYRSQSANTSLYPQKQ